MEINDVIEKAFKRELTNCEEQWGCQFTEDEKQEVLDFAKSKIDMWESSSQDKHPYAFFALTIRSSFVRIYYDKKKI
jgi:hypothetical protein